MNNFYRKLFKKICKANNKGSKTISAQYQSTRYKKTITRKQFLKTQCIVKAVFEKIELRNQRIRSTSSL